MKQDEACAVRYVSNGLDGAKTFIEFSPMRHEASEAWGKEKDGRSRKAMGWNTHEEAMVEEVGSYQQKLLFIFESKQYLLALTVAIALLTGSAVAQAQDPSEVPSRLDAIRNRQEREQQEEAIREQIERSQFTPAVPESPVPVKSDEDPVDFFIERIELLGDDAPGQVRLAILRRYENTRMGSAELLTLVRELTDAYGADGYVSTTVTLLRQNIKSGHLGVQVNWGYVSDWRFEGQPARTWRERWLQAMLPRLKGKRLKIQDIDQAVEVLNNGVESAQIDIMPSETLAYSNLNIAPRPIRPWNLSLNLDNSGLGAHDAGRYRLSADLKFAGLGADVWGINVGQRYYDGDSDDTERNWSAFGTIPLGYWGLETRYNASTYRRVIGGAFGEYVSSGRSGEGSLKISRTFARSQSGKSTGFVKLSHRETENFIDGFRLDNSRAYSDLAFGLTRLDRLWGGVLYSDIAFGKGLRWLGADDTEADSNSGVTPALYSKLFGNVSWTRSWQVGDTHINYNARLGWQYARDPVLGAGKLTLGDEYTVRGYKGGVYGDRGAYLSNTLELPLMSGRVVPFVGVDGGVVRDIGQPSQHLHGAAVGLRTQSKKSWLTLTYAQPLGSSRSYVRADEVVYVNGGIGF